MTRVAIVSTVYERKEPLQKLIEDLNLQSEKNLQLIIVDHSPEKIKFDIPHDLDITILKSNPSLWFTAAMNEGLKYILKLSEKPEFVILCNDDVRLPDTHWISEMLRHCGEQDLIASMALDEKGQCFYSAVYFSYFRMRYVLENSGKKISIPHSPAIKTCDVLPTRGLILSTKALEKIGLLNEEALPMYGSDYEWTHRAKNKGFQLKMLRSSYLVTDESPNSVGPGKRLFSSPKFKNFLDHFFSPFKNESLPTIYNYSRLVFPTGFAQAYLIWHILRKFGGFFITNFLTKKKK